MKQVVLLRYLYYEIGYEIIWNHEGSLWREYLDDGVSVGELEQRGAHDAHHGKAPVQRLRVHLRLGGGRRLGLRV
jgi:hypothetical protein